MEDCPQIPIAAGRIIYTCAILDRSPVSLHQIPFLGVQFLQWEGLPK